MSGLWEKDLKSRSSEDEEHIQEDIVPAHVEATKFIRRAYHCSHCRKLQRAPYAPGEVPYGYLGPNVLIQAILLKYHHGLSYLKCQSFSKTCVA